MISRQSKPRLSKGILDMKFMQRTKAKVDKEIEEAEGRAMYSNEITEKMLNQNCNFIQEPSFVYCEGLIEGRLSFRGMNPEIERLLELEQAEREASMKQEQPKDVTDQEMAKFYHEQQAPAATHTMQKKFQNKRKINNNSQNKGTKEAANVPAAVRRNKKSKFQKPRDDDEN